VHGGVSRWPSIWEGDSPLCPRFVRHTPTARSAVFGDRSRWAAVGCGRGAVLCARILSDGEDAVHPAPGGYGPGEGYRTIGWLDSPRRAPHGGDSKEIDGLARLRLLAPGFRDPGMRSIRFLRSFWRVVNQSAHCFGCLENPGALCSNEERWRFVAEAPPERQPATR
jgi:hypothetical protein